MCRHFLFFFAEILHDALLTQIVDLPDRDFRIKYATTGAASHASPAFLVSLRLPDGSWLPLGSGEGPEISLTATELP